MLLEALHNKVKPEKTKKNLNSELLSRPNSLLNMQKRLVTKNIKEKTPQKKVRMSVCSAV
jgi:hypothetical protein